MADMNRQVADRAQALAVIALEARNTAQTGRESVQQTFEGMGRIHAYVQDTAGKVQALGDNSREINNIVGVISTIAQQTNRLALDAAVQAATAGEHGKGFGAVAADIRRLAERAKDQASSIARIVRTVNEEIDAASLSMKDTERETSLGAKQAEEIGSALESIFGVVELQSSEIEVINQMANHQLQSSNAVARIMQNVSGLTQQSSANTRGAARNMEHLARLAEQLLRSVEAFKLPENPNYAALPQNLLSAEKGYSTNGMANTVRPGVTVTMRPQEMGQLAYPERNNSGLLGLPSLTQSGSPGQGQRPYPGKSNNSSTLPPNQGQPGGQRPYPGRSNNSGTLPPNQGQPGSQRPYPGRSNSGPLPPPSRGQNGNKLQQNRLQRPPVPPEKQ